MRPIFILLNKYYLCGLLQELHVPAEDCVVIIIIILIFANWTANFIIVIVLLFRKITSGYYNFSCNKNKFVVTIVHIIIMNFSSQIALILLFSQQGESYSQQDKGVKNNVVRCDNKYFCPLKQHSV